jgi:hypothetical protein
VLGLLQDLLRVPRSKWVIIVYLIVLLLPLLLSFLIAVIGGWPGARVTPNPFGELALLVLIVAPNATILFSIGSIVVYSFIRGKTI